MTGFRQPACWQPLDDAQSESFEMLLLWTRIIATTGHRRSVSGERLYGEVGQQFTPESVCS
jgi:hypothetical protein